ncbi:MAG: hypothetical protein AMXMBFR33_66970 [Candidatus Xenobia bacterium]
MKLSQRQQAHLRSLPARLSAAGYHERELADLFELCDLYVLRDGISARTLARAQQDTPLAHLGSFWFLGQTRPRALLEGLMGAQALAVLERLDLVQDSPDGLKARALLFPCLGRYLFTDLFAPVGDPQFQVYWLGSDSLGLARCAPRKPVGRSLDLCTGSGVHAVLAASHASEAWGVDINPRALHISRINALMNGQGAVCNFAQGSLYEPLPEGRFGLITANPPFVPTPRSDLAFFRPGGETGEAITEAIVRGLPERLEVGGTLALVSQHPVIRGSHLLDRVESWLGGADGWGLAYLMMAPLDRDEMIAGHIDTPGQFATRLGVEEGAAAYRREFETWLDSYEANGIEGVELGLFYVRRLEPGLPGWRTECHLNLPSGSLSSWVEDWLDAQERFSRLPDPGWKPTWTPGCQRVMLDARNGEGFVFRDPACRLGDFYLSPENAFLLDRADGRQSARQLAQSFALRFERKAGEGLTRLADLGRQLLVR